MLLRKEASSVQAIFEVEIRFNDMIVTTSLLNKIIFQLEKAFFSRGGILLQIKSAWFDRYQIRAAKRADCSSLAADIIFSVCYNIPSS